MAFKERLRELRKSKNMLQRELAEKLSYGESTISNYEKGNNEPSIADLKKIAAVFNVSLDYLLCATDIKTPYGKGSEYSEKTSSLITKLADFSDERLDEFSRFIDWLDFRDDDGFITKTAHQRNRLQIVAQTNEPYHTK